MRRAAPLLLLAALAAAGDDDARRLQPDHAPTPYTAEQIRAACLDGRVSVYSVGADHEDHRWTFRFTNGDEKGTDLETTVTDAEGKVIGKPKKSHPTWKELQAHASYPEKQTKITQEEIETKAGKFACTLYTVTKREGEDAEVTRAWFATKLPGPPVKLVTEVGGKVVFAMTLVEHKDGEAKPKPKPKEEEPPK